MNNKNLFNAETEDLFRLQELDFDTHIEMESQPCVYCDNMTTHIEEINIDEYNQQYIKLQHVCPRCANGGFREIV